MRGQNTGPDTVPCLAGGELWTVCVGEGGLGWPVAPGHHARLPHPPGHPGAGADLLGNIKTLLDLLQAGQQPGDRLANLLGLQVALLLRALNHHLLYPGEP